MKQIVMSLGTLVFVAAVVAGGTGAFFSDTETSGGNVFTAGAIDLRIDHAGASYNGEECEVDCNEIGTDLIVNGGFEDPALNNGQWQIYPAGIPGWEVVSGGGIEVQNNAAGAPHTGSQLIELDSDSSTVMSQTITTVPGEKYRLTFWHSPRPGISASQNIVGYEVQVVSGSATIIDGQVGVGQSGGGNTNWTEYTFDFIARDASTKVIFSDDGPSNTFGGYLDDVSVYELDCVSGVYIQTPGGFCELWEEKDLENESFFNFSDVKPQDSGMSLISLHVDSNDAYLCLEVANQEDDENTNISPEIDAGDVTVPGGELGAFLMVAAYYSDEFGTKLDQFLAPTPVGEVDSLAFADSSTAQPPVLGNSTEYMLLEWCLGTLENNGTCDGNVVDINQTQTDSFIADLQFSAIQTRNNENYTCTEPLPEDED